MLTPAIRTEEELLVGKKEEEEVRIRSLVSTIYRPVEIRTD